MYVDDFMIIAGSEPVLNHVFGDVSVVKGRKHDYLEMVFDFTSNDCLRLSMLTTVDDILRGALIGYDVASSPGSNNLFSIASTGAFSSDTDRESYFRFMVDKLLYLAKRVRPDRLPCYFIFPSMRVRCLVEQDMSKLTRVLKYLNGIKTLGLSIRGETAVCVCAYMLMLRKVISTRILELSSA